jgi:hypothetical protein
MAVGASATDPPLSAGIVPWRLRRSRQASNPARIATQGPYSFARS